MTLAELLQSRRDEILKRWLQLVRETGVPGGLTRAELMDSMPIFVDALVLRLREENGERVVAPSEQTTANVHGEERSQLGFSLEGVLREYGILRDVVLAVIDEAGLTVSLREFRVLLHALSNGTTAAAVTFAREQTRSIRESEERFRILVQATSAVVWTTNPAGAIVVDAPSWMAFTGQTAEEHRGWGWLEAIHPEDRERIRTEWTKAVGTRAHYETQYRLRRIDGAWAHTLARGVPVLNEDATLREWVGANTDVTHRVRAEEELLRGAEFAEQLVGIASHDLRTPLTAILTSAAVLLRREPDERVATPVRRIVASSRRAARMIDDLLDFTRARVGGGIPLQRAPVDAHPLVDQVVDELRLTHPGREVHVSHHGPGTGAWDPARLGQLVSNLVANALGYGASGRLVTVAVEGANGELSIRVHNAGAPISPDALPHIFEPFKRGRQEEAGERSLGLGLYIVDRIVSAHGGRVEVTSTAEAGTEFRVRLPLVSAAGAAFEAAAPRG